MKLKIRSGVQHVTRKSEDGTVASTRLHVTVETKEHGKILARFVLNADQMAVLLAGGSVDVEGE